MNSLIEHDPREAISLINSDDKFRRQSMRVFFFFLSFILTSSRTRARVYADKLLEFEKRGGGRERERGDV